jgi:spore coat protein U-like protein
MHSKMMNLPRAMALACLVFVMPAAYGQPVFNATCRLSIEAVRFGMYNPIDDVDLLNNSGYVRIQCTSPSTGTVSYNITLGTGSSNTYSARTLRVATHFLEYNLFTTAAYSNVWGDGSNGSSPLLGSLGVTAGATIDGPIHTIYSRIIKRQYKPGGVYGDSIAVTTVF